MGVWESISVSLISPADLGDDSSFTETVKESSSVLSDGSRSRSQD